MESHYQDIDSSPESYRNASKQSINQEYSKNSNRTEGHSSVATNDVSNMCQKQMDNIETSDNKYYASDGSRKVNYYLRRLTPSSKLENISWKIVYREDIL